jgi:hypothetical protein
VINATDLSVTDVDWPGYPALFTIPAALDLDQDYQVLQVVFWSQKAQSWVKLVPTKVGEEGVLEVTPGDIEAIVAGEAQGLPKVEAIRRVLGVMVAL